MSIQNAHPKTTHQFLSDTSDKLCDLSSNVKGFTAAIDALNDATGAFMGSSPHTTSFHILLNLLAEQSKHIDDISRQLLNHTQEAVQ